MRKYLIFFMVFFISAIACAESNIQMYQDMLVTENLRMRTSKYDGRKIITVLNAGTRVKIIDIGETETIEGIENNWVEVEVQKNARDKDGNEVKYGVIGWCFGGYLQETEQLPFQANYGNGNGMRISESENEDQNILIRKHIQKVTIGDLAWGEERIIYSDINKSRIIYNLKNNDEIKISEIWSTKDNNNVWLKVDIYEYSGFVPISFDPYENNKWEIIEKIDNKWTVRKMKQSLSVFANKDEVELWDKPGDKDSKVIAFVPSSYRNGQSQINLVIEAITEEKDIQKGNDRWARTTYNGKTGWIYGGYLSAERGGPTYYIPEDRIAFNLGIAP